MAKVNFDMLDEVEASTGNANGSGTDVGFFTLKNDNDEAVVRFMCDSTNDFEILTIHDVKVGEKYRKVNCIRDPREPLDRCPLCANEKKISNKFFIRMIQYFKETNEQGQVVIVPKAMIWERSTAYAKTLKSYLDNYGPLSDIICKVIRHGKAGDMQTTYEIVPNLSKTVYSDEVYVKDPTLFNGFEALGTIVMNKSFEEINQFIATGEFPQVARQSTAAEVTPRTATPVESPVPNSYTPPQYQTVPTTGTVTNTPVGYTTVNPGPVNTTPTKSWENPSGATTGFDRPRRY